MSNTPGAEAQANKQAGRNRPSDIDELRDNIADIASGVGEMASPQYGQAHDVATDAVEETIQIIRRNPLASIGVGLGVGFLLGLKDRVVKDSQAVRLHEEIPHSVLRLIPGVGHMVHYAVPDEVARAIEEVGKPATMFRRPGRTPASYTASAA